jgi:2-methylcitrate dehydratase PrpD
MQREGGAPATVICSGVRTSHDRAVFANGVMIRYLDFNDAYSTPIGGGHPSDSLAALICSAEIAGSSVPRTLDAATGLFTTRWLTARGAMQQ